MGKFTVMISTEGNIYKKCLRKLGRKTNKVKNRKFKINRKILESKIESEIIWKIITKRQKMLQILKNRNFIMWKTTATLRISAIKKETDPPQVQMTPHKNSLRNSTIMKRRLVNKLGTVAPL